MVRTRVGYAGGVTRRPTYHDLGDHAEAVQLDFDPERMSYGELLDLFFAGHRPTRQAWSRQYRSAILVAGEEQRRLAAERVRQVAEHRGSEVFVEILPADSFHRAEDYHQKYYLQRHAELTAELRAPYPEFRDFVDSTAAARLNGYLGGSRTHDLRRVDLGRLGLSPVGQRILLKEARRYGASCSSG